MEGDKGTKYKIELTAYSHKKEIKMKYQTEWTRWNRYFMVIVGSIIIIMYHVWRTQKSIFLFCPLRVTYSNWFVLSQLSFLWKTKFWTKLSITILKNTITESKYHSKRISFTMHWYQANIQQIFCFFLPSINFSFFHFLSKFKLNDNFSFFLFKEFFI